MVSAGMRTDDFNSKIKEKIEENVNKFKIQAELFSELQKEIEKIVPSQKNNFMVILLR